MMLRFFIVFLFLIHPQKNAFAQTVDSTTYKIGLSRLGENFDFQYNQEGSFVLCTKEVENTENNLPVVKYLVIRMYDKKIVEEGSVTMSQVIWSGLYELEVSQKPGQIQLSRDDHSVQKKIDLRKHLKNLAPR
jgi:hypothetical protein